MPSNVVLNPGAAGATAATAQISHDGDTAQLQLIGLMGITGTEDAYTAAKINGDATNGLDVDVTRLPALPAGTNNIGDVDILSVVPGTAATNLGKAEDAAHASGDVGVMALAVRKDTATQLAAVDGNYSPLITDAAGRLHVNVGAALPAGTNNIGDVDILSIAAGDNNIGNVDVVTLPALAAGTNNIGDVDVLSLPAGSIAATTAKTSDYDTGAGTDTVPMMGLALPASGGAVQGGTATNPVRTDPTGTTTQPVSGTVTANLAAGTNNIGDVDVLSVVPGTAATALGKAVDDPAGATDTGTAVLAVRDDALTTLTPVDGDYVPLRVNSTGALHVTGGGGGTEYAVDTALGATPTGSLVLAIRDDALSALTPVEGDAIGLRVDANGALWVIPSGTTTVAGTVTANLAAGTNNIGDIDVLSIAAGDNNIGNVDIVTVPADPFGVNADAASATGSISAKLRFIAATGIPVTSIAAGDNNIGNVDVVTLPALPTGTNAIGTVTAVGSGAHDAAISGNPVRIAARGLSADYTAVATGDTVDIAATLLGKQVVYPYALPGADWHYAAASGGIVNTTGVTAKAAAGAGIRNYITRIQVINGHATVSTDFQIRDGAAGTVLWRGFLQAAGGGVACDFDPPLRGTANTLIEIACGTTGSAVYANLHGFAAAE